MFIGMFALFVLACGGFAIYDHVNSPKDLTREVLLGITRLNAQSPSLSLQEISERHYGEKADCFFFATAYAVPYEYGNKNYSWSGLAVWTTFSEQDNYLIATRGDRAIWYALIPGNLVPQSKAGFIPINDILTPHPGFNASAQVQYQILETTNPQVTRFNDLMR